MIYRRPVVLKLMRREDLLTQVCDVLSKVGFFVSDPTQVRCGAFDFLARRDEKLLVCKVFLNVDSFSKGNSRELKILANGLGAAPIIIGSHGGTGGLEDDIVYYRHGIPIISFGTLQNYFVEGIPPFIYAAPGGLYVHLDGELLREIRHHRKISLGTLAEIAGVSRRTIQMYEEGMGAVIDAAVRLEEFLDQPIIHEVDPTSVVVEVEEVSDDFANTEGFHRAVFTRLASLGYRVTPTTRCPFDALSAQDEVLLTGISVQERGVRRKAKIAAAISAIVERPSVIFIERSEKESLEGTPVISRKELEKADEPKTILELILERQVLD